MVTRTVRNYEIKAQSKAELDTIERMYETETYTSPEFRKYFDVWFEPGNGIYYFIKPKYFVSRNGVTNYAIALLEYGTGLLAFKEVAVRESDEDNE